MHREEIIDGEPMLVGVVSSALVHAPVAPVLAEPHVSSGQVSQLLAGQRVEIIETHGDWNLVRGVDDYEGWMHRGYFSPDAGATADDRAGRLSLGCVVRDADGGRRALPLRALLRSDDVVETGDVVDAADVAARFPTDATAITRSAVGLFEGTSYQWGGVTPWGADCSGLVQSIFGLHGIALPRDAWQQARTGRDAGRDVRALQAADLLFFSDRPDAHVTHVAISLGEGRLVHLALGRGGYAVESLDDAHDPYVAKLRARFLFARTVL